MALLEMKDAIDRLVDLLDRERRLILSGQLNGLRRLLVEKDRLIATVSQLDSGSDRLQIVRDKSARNQQLLHAAAAGLRSAKEYLDHQGQAGGSLATYDRSGCRTEQRVTQSSFIRRA